MRNLVHRIDACIHAKNFLRAPAFFFSLKLVFLANCPSRGIVDHPTYKDKDQFERSSWTTNWRSWEGKREKEKENSELQGHFLFQSGGANHSESNLIETFPGDVLEWLPEMIIGVIWLNWALLLTINSGFFFRKKEKKIIWDTLKRMSETRFK